MKKLYKKTNNGVEYAEAWVAEGKCIFHFGVVGDRGQTQNFSVTGSPEEAINAALKNSAANGFAELAVEKHYLLTFTFETEEDWGSQEDLDKKNLVEEVLNEELGWTGNGKCDGFDIGSGEMTLFSIVVDLDAAIEATFAELGEIGLLDGTVVRSRKVSEENFIEHEVPEEYQNHAFNEPEEEIVPPTNHDEWMAETNPKAIRAALDESQLDLRRCRLYAVACCRRIWDLLIHPHTRENVEFVEKLADGLVDENQLEEVNDKADTIFSNTSMTDLYKDGEMDEIAEMDGDLEIIKHLCELADQANVDDSAVADAAAAVSDLGESEPSSIVNTEMCAAWAAAKLYDNTTEQDEMRFQCDLLRCIFPSPFNPPKLDSSWFAPAVVELANQIYDSRDFEKMPHLGELLRENDCNEESVLTHCTATNHTRGSWLLDAIRNSSNR